MSTDSLVFLKQIVDNAEFANETGVLNVIALFKDPDPGVRDGTTYAAGAFDTLLRLLELRPDLLTPAVVGQLETLANDPDQRVRSAAKAALETAGVEESVAGSDLVGEIPERTRPASDRTRSLSDVRRRLEQEFGTECPEDDPLKRCSRCAFRDYVEEHFAPPEYEYWFFLTPGELCDVVDCYADQLTVKWNENDRRLSAKSDVLVRLDWTAHPDLNGFVLAGLYAFDTPREARDVWLDERIYPEDMPIERVLDVRGRHALNFQSGNYSWRDDDLEDIRPDELWPRIWRYYQAVGAPIDM